MEKDVIVFLGMPKTGTSFLHSKVFPNIHEVDFFSEIPVRYKSTKNKILISSGLCGTPLYSFEQELDDRNKVLDKLYSIYPDARLILIVRDIKSAVVSWYSQYVEYGGLKDLENFVHSELDHDWFNVESYINKMKEMFPEIYIGNFESLKKDETSFVKNICKFMDVDVPIYDTGVVNKGWTSQQKSLGRFLNKFWKTSRYYIDNYLVGNR